MINSFVFDNPMQAHDKMCESFVFGDNTETVNFDWAHGTEVGLHNVIIGCKSFDYNFNLKRLWMPGSRWTTMVRQYIDPDGLPWSVSTSIPMR